MPSRPRRRTAPSVHTRRRPLRWVLRGVVAVLVLAAVGVGATAWRVWQVARIDDRDRVEAIVVLGASQFDGRPSPIFQARLRQAQTLYDQKVAPRIITVGGGGPGDRFTEAEAGARFLRRRGVPAAAVQAVGEGTNTAESLEAVARVLVDVRSVVLVTDPWHSLRSRRIARDLGFEASTSPARTGPVVRSRAIQARYIVREAGAYLYYRVLGRGADRDVPAAV
ncbi:MAG TPA: YdcF family protein [Mycobacteriales bacterium]|nr:YdcF family protein [Mycobacteriales bacterium]